MEQFAGVTVVKRANVYFDGKVTSRTIVFADGSRNTLGIMLPGEYEFPTGPREDVEVLGGVVEVLLPMEQEWRRFEGQGRFTVPANASFKLKVHETFDYCCRFVSA